MGYLDADKHLSERNWTPKMNRGQRRATSHSYTLPSFDWPLFSSSLSLSRSLLNVFTSNCRLWLEKSGCRPALIVSWLENRRLIDEDGPALFVARAPRQLSRLFLSFSLSLSLSLWLLGLYTVIIIGRIGLLTRVSTFVRMSAYDYTLGNGSSGCLCRSTMCLCK